MNTPPRVLIVGAGPAGLAAAACLKKLGKSARFVDREELVGGAYARMNPAITLSSPSRFVHLPHLEHQHTEAYITAGRYGAYLERYASELGLSPEAAELVSLSVNTNGDFVAEFHDDTSTVYEAVVVATGMFDFPRLPEIPGLQDDAEAPEVVHASDWREPREGERLLVIGGATSAIEVAEACGHAGIGVTVSARSGIAIMRQRAFGRDLHDVFYPLLKYLPVWTARGFCEKAPTQPGIDLGFKKLKRRGLIQVRGGVQRFEGKTACFSGGHREDFDRVVCATGFDYGVSFLPAGVERARAGHPRCRDNQSVNVPGLFFLGFPCSRAVLSEFLAGISNDAPKMARDIAGYLEGRPPRVHERQVRGRSM